MLLLLFSQEAFFIKSDDDLIMINSDMPSYLTRSVVHDGQSGINISNSFIDCRGFTITADVVLFNQMESSQLYNCIF